MILGWLRTILLLLVNAVPLLPAAAAVPLFDPNRFPITAVRSGDAGWISAICLAVIAFNQQSVK